MWTTFAFYKAVLQQTPLWVWVVLASLCVLSIRQLKDRTVPPWTVLIAPVVFMGVGVVGTGRGGVSLVAWALAAASCAALAARHLPLAPGTRFLPESRRLFVPGGLSAGAWMLGTFLFTYGINVLFAVEPALGARSEAKVVAASLTGVLTGTLFGRSLRQFWLR